LQPAPAPSLPKEKADQVARQPAGAPVAQGQASRIGGDLGTPMVTTFPVQVTRVLRGADPGRQVTVTQPGGEVARATTAGGGPRDHAAVVKIPPTGIPLEDIERHALVEALKMSNWVQKDAAELLSISPRVMNYKIKTLGIEFPRGRRAAPLVAAAS